jgi:AraC-like DNA-binding protein
LAESERPIIEIAAACGYANLSNFNRQFLHLKNTTPRRFRERFQAIHGLGGG